MLGVVYGRYAIVWYGIVWYGIVWYCRNRKREREVGRWEGGKVGRRGCPGKTMLTEFPT